MTQPEQIMRAVLGLARKGTKTFTRVQVRKELGVPTDRWKASYSPTFQGMRIDQPGGAPDVGARYRGVLRQIKRAHHTLTEKGQRLLRELEERDSSFKSSERLELGNVYTRKDLKALFNIKDANINNGVFRPKGHNSVWLFVTEKKGKDRTQYSDQLAGDMLRWDGQLRGRTDHLVIDHERLGLELLLFYRKTVREFPGAGFVYEGCFDLVSHKGNNPKHFVLTRATKVEESVASDLESMQYEEEHFEGGKKQRYTNYYERNPRLRSAAIRYHGMNCQGCGFNFEAAYGERGAGYIEVHHLRSVSRLEKKVKVDPVLDMSVVCANCHRMIHRRRDLVLSLDELRRIVLMKNPG